MYLINNDIGDNIQFEVLLSISSNISYEKQFNQNKLYFYRSIKDNEEIILNNDFEHSFIPINNSKGELVAVIQLNNKNSSYLLFSEDNKLYLDFFSIFISLLYEKNLLKENVNNLFDSIIVSMINTMEQRDPITSNHSRKVADLMVIFSEAINNTKSGKYKELSFNEIKTLELYYAGLLHDIGKIGIRDNLLLKNKRISMKGLEVIKYRFSYVKMYLLHKSTYEKLDDSEKELKEKIDSFYSFIEELNRYTTISEEIKEKLIKIYNYKFIDVDGKTKNLISNTELENLIVENGNLSEEEMEYIKFHTEYSYLILKTIPWSKEYINVPIIARDHHERLDGSGYDRGLKEEEIMLETRMLSIVDVFEALTSKDRPYKVPSTSEEAIEIMSELASSNKLDKDLFEIFVNEKVYLHVMQ